MIIFDLDGTLADCEHRRHFVDPAKSGMIEWINLEDGKRKFGSDYKDGFFQEWKPDWKLFYEACDQDKPIKPTIQVLNYIYRKQIQESSDHFSSIQIWSGRCESTRQNTLIWFYKNSIPTNITLKMRPIGDSTPDDILKERWLDEATHKGKTIDFVFDDRPKVIRMWRRRGIFVFDCNQTGGEF